MKEYKPQNVMKSRAALLFILFILGLIFLSVKLIEINFLDNNNYKQTVLSQQVNNLTDTTNQVIPKRGSILDARGIAFAESNMVYNVIFDPAVLIELDEAVVTTTIDFLSSALEGVDKEDLEELMVTRYMSHYEVIVRGLSYPQAEPIIKAKDDKLISGVAFEEQYKREYPYDNMASDVIGFMQSDDVGLWGIEKVYDTYLTGSLGRRFGSVDAENRIKQEDVDAENGYDITLNIDFTIQSYIEDAIKNFYEEEQAISVEVVMMNPQNGAVLGIASYPDFNLNDPYNISHLVSEEEKALMTDEEVGDFRNQLWKNGVVSDSYEPGSTYKPFTIAMALEEHVVTEESTYYCGGYKIPYENHKPIYCHKRSGHGEQTLMEALSNSCNVALMDIGLEVGREFFYEYQHMFGFGAQTSIDLTGEQSVRKNVYTLNELDPVQLQTSSFGQGFNVTPIQLITGFSALINGGYLYEPQIMNKVTDETGRLIEQNEPVIQRKVISEEVSDQMLNALRQVVDEGTGKNAKVEGYSIGGKTGTAEKKDRSVKEYVVSFIGFSPTENPEVICLVVVDEPVGINVSSRYASKIFKDIMEDALPYLRIPKEYDVTEAE